MIKTEPGAGHFKSADSNGPSLFVGSQLLPVPRPQFRIVLPGALGPIQPPTIDSPPEKFDPVKSVYLARHKLERKFANAVAKANGDRLNWVDQLAVLEQVYSTVQDWRGGGWVRMAEALLRRLAPRRIGPGSNLSLVLLRSVLPELSPKRASKWAAALELSSRKGVLRGSLGGFLAKYGGIEGAAREMARFPGEKART